MPAQTTRVTFPGASGQRLSANLERPAGTPRAFVLFAHCFTCSKGSTATVSISRALTSHGFAVLRFDFTGLGGSQGEFADTNFSSNVQDLLAAAAWLREHHEAPQLLVGHSLGGAAVIMAAAQLDEVVAVATIGAPCDPAHVQHLFQEDAETIARNGQACVSIAGRTFTIKKQFIDDINAQNMRDVLAKLGRALLVFHSPLDQVVGVDNARRIYDAARHPKSFVSLDQADHLLTRRADATYVAGVLAAWATRYLDEDASDRAPTFHDAADDEAVYVQNARAVGPFAQDLTVRGHLLRADEPASVNGTDTGPTPYDLLSASLGACTAMTVRMYADRKGWPLRDVRVRVTHAKVHAKDCADCPETEGKPDVLERIVTLDGPELTEAQQTRLMDIADRCPVHRTLQGPLHIATSRADA